MPPRPAVAVAIVEDHPIYADALAKPLAEAGFRVAVPVQTVESLDLDARPDVVVCDLYLPARSGRDAIAYLSQLGCRVLATSGVARREEVLVAVGAGAHGFVEKSMRAEVFVDAVANVAEGHCYADPYLARYLLDDASHRPLRAADIGAGERALLRRLAQGEHLKEAAAMESLTVEAAQATLDRVFEFGRRRRAVHWPTPREMDVIRLIGREGMTQREAARQLGIATHTVAEVLANIRLKYLASHPESTRPAATSNPGPRAAAVLWAQELGALCLRPEP